MLVDDLELADQAHLAKAGVLEVLHRSTREVRLAFCTWQAGGDAQGQENRVLWGIGIVLFTSIRLVALRTIVPHQILAINLPLRLRWDFRSLVRCSR